MERHYRPRLFKRLRGELLVREVNCGWLAQKLNLHPQSLSARMTGRTPWSIEEAYKVLELLGLPDADIRLYFPPGGVDKVL